MCDAAHSFSDLISDALTLFALRMGSLPPDIELGAPPKRLLDGSGGVTEATLSWLRSLEATAAGSARYERAAYIRDLIEVIRPQPKLTALECAPDTLEEQAQFFFENGACLTPVQTPLQVAPDPSASQVSW